MFALEALPRPGLIPNWLIKSIILVPLLLGGLYAGLWLAAEPFCLHCFHHGGAITGWNYKHEVTEYWCFSCNGRWKPPINLHRRIPLSRSCGLMDVFY